MDRRDWLKTSLLALCGASFGSHGQWVKANTDGRRLILVELSGANDGLNTLAPIRNDYYHSLRPSLSLARNQVIELQDDHGMHEALKPLTTAWQRGELAWVHGLGYPSANRSHFKSIELWESGGDGQIAGRTGWMTHDIEHALGRAVTDPHGISLVNDMNIFHSASGRWLSMSSPKQLMVGRNDVDASVQDVNATIQLVTARMQELDSTLVQLQKRLANAPKVPAIGRGQLGGHLQQVLRLIRAGIDTPVYRVQLGGFDTHQNQLGRHNNLLSQLGMSLAQFRAALIQDGEWDNTLIMTYSEFGRRAAENKSGGTDHGTAAPHLVMGGQINGGLYGEPTDLSNLVDGDPEFTMDYRSLYSQVLATWFGIDYNQFQAFNNPLLATLVKNG